jgi:sensor histidine kinase YesM
MKNKAIINILKSRITRHTLFWIAYLILNTIMYGQFRGDYILQFKLHLFYLPVVFAASYFTLYFLIPKFLQQRRYFYFILLLLVSAFIFSVIQRINIYLIVIPLYFPQMLEKFQFFSFDLVFRILKIYPPVILATSIKLFMEWYQDQQIFQQLAKEKLEAELKFLRSQIHPHFLFNILNSLYALTLKKSEKAPEVVLKLSELLNYMLYDCNAAFVSLNKEINLINDYIDLEKLRYGDKLKIEFNLKKSKSDNQIAPLLLLPFVENSFKHGVSKKVSDKWIKIDLSINENKLLLKIINSKNSNQTENDQDYTEGIGLLNVKRRLDLLYEDKHHLEINENETEFEVYLQLQLN